MKGLTSKQQKCISGKFVRTAKYVRSPGNSPPALKPCATDGLEIPERSTLVPLVAPRASKTVKLQAFLPDGPHVVRISRVTPYKELPSGVRGSGTLGGTFHPVAPRCAINECILFECPTSF